ncbi:unnamed protein product [Sphagnum tenellum]
MVKMKTHSELEDSQISKLNECFLVADRIRKAGRDSRQGFGKCKNKPNPNGGGTRTSVPSSSRISLFANGPLALVTPSAQCSPEASLTPSFFLPGSSLGKEERKETRAQKEISAAPKAPEKCQTPIRLAQATSERSDGGAPEGNWQRSHSELTIAATPGHEISGAEETISRPPPPQVSPPHSLPLRSSESDSVFGGVGQEQSALQNSARVLEAPPPGFPDINYAPHERFLSSPLRGRRGSHSGQKAGHSRVERPCSFFFRYNPSFDANAQGAEALLTHAIKVQFPDLHEQFRNQRALTIMASKLGEVLEIEAADSYIKRPAGPMVIIEVKDISKLAGYIRIPSMAEGATYTDTIRQAILYSGLPNQCRKCRRFGHQARTCNSDRNGLQAGPTFKAAPREEDRTFPKKRPVTDIASRVREQPSAADSRHVSRRGGIEASKERDSGPLGRERPAKNARKRHEDRLGDEEGSANGRIPAIARTGRGKRSS